MKFNDFALCFSKSCCGSHSGYIFDIASTYRKSCDQPRSTKIWSMHFLHVFPMYLQCFYISATQLQVVDGTNHTTDLSQHEALKGAHVRQVTLCVAFGALLCGTYFSVSRRCSKYSTIRMLWSTFVRQTTLSVTFGKRRRSIPVGLLDRSFDHSNHASRPRTPERHRNGSAERRFGAPPSPRDAIRTLLWHARGYIQTSSQISSVGGSAVHMKWPDDIGREAGIGRTQDGDGLSVFRACP